MTQSELQEDLPLPPPPADESKSLTDQLIKEINGLIDAEHSEEVTTIYNTLHAADQAELLNILTPARMRFLVDVTQENFNADALPDLNPESREQVIEQLGAEKCAEALTQLDTDDAVQVIEDLDEEEQQEILEALEDDAYREELEEGLSYPEYSAGRLMRKKLVSVPEFWTVGQTIDHLRANHDTLPSDFYVLFVTDPKFKLAGSVMLSRVMTSIRDVKIQDIMSPDVHAIEATIDQEEVSHIFRKYGLVEAPVVNNSERLMGVITVDDVVDVIKDEDEEDILLLGGVSQQDFHIGVRDTIKSRFPWLFINLFTAIIASLVIERFDGAIAQIVALAVLMPIVASMGGNAGIQAVTVSIRALTTKELKPSNAFSAIRKELFVGGINGILLAIIMGTGIFLWYQDTQLAFVFGAATVITLFSGGLAGVLVPIILQRMKIDPAVASGVILTTVTDVIGFLAFLGLATMLLIS